MADLSTYFKNPKLNLRLTTVRSVLRMGVIASALALLGCAGDVGVTVENTQAAQEMARLSRPPGSVYTGWRVFQERCAACHGPDATGTGRAPDLLPRVQQMGPRRFVGLVLKRYDWNLPPPAAGQTMDTLIDDVMQRKEPGISMPAWEDNPSVSGHIADLYAYLSARAEGTQGKGRPLP